MLDSISIKHQKQIINLLNYHDRLHLALYPRIILNGCDSELPFLKILLSLQFFVLFFPFLKLQVLLQLIVFQLNNQQTISSYSLLQLLFLQMLFYMHLKLIKSQFLQLHRLKLQVYLLPLFLLLLQLLDQYFQNLLQNLRLFLLFQANY